MKNEKKIIVSDMSKKRGKAALKKFVTPKTGGVTSSMYVRNASKQQKETKRMGIATRILITVIILALTAVFTAFVVLYLIPFMRSEMEIEDGASSAISFVSEAESAVPQYDEFGLEVYDDTVNLLIINAQHKAESTDIPETEQVSGVLINKKIAGAVRYLVDTAKNEGLALQFSAGYISYSEQEAIYNAEVDRLMQEEGFTLVMAREEAKDSVALAAESDFQTGMCLKVKGDAETFQASQTYDWLTKNMTKYGFIFRFPKDKETVTGRETDYTVIRYVGRDNAEKVTRLSMCLEEYIDYLEEQLN